MQNDNWQDDSAQAAQLVALGLAPQDPNESGIVATLPPGLYTALMAGKNQTSGIGLVEIYDVDAAADSQLANISTRGFVQTGDNVMIGGFILGQGSASTAVAVRGIGPSLSQSGLSDVLADPTLELHDANGALLIANDNWQDDPFAATQLSANGLAPQDPLESGIFTTLPPGLFTAILAGKNGGVGLGLVEIYSGLQAATLTVTNTADSGAGSLRDAIGAARDGDTIQFVVALKGQTITLTSAELVIANNITIRGPGPSQLTVQRSTAGGTPAFGIFHVMPGHTVMIEGLTISGGRNEALGGGIFNDQATLTVNDCAVVTNYSHFSGGGICNYGASARLTIVNSAVNANLGPGDGGGYGGGIYNDSGMLEIRHSTVSDNRIGFNLPPMFGATAGGIYSNGTLEISDSTVSGNFAIRDGGGIVNYNGTMTITNSTVSSNTVPGYQGGGIENLGPLTITNSTISGNTVTYQQSGVGGGIANAGVLTITNSTISGNNADGGDFSAGPLDDVAIR